MHTENHKAGKKRVINSSKTSTYDPRRAKEIRNTKSLAIKKKYQKLKSKLGDVKVRCVCSGVPQQSLISVLMLLEISNVDIRFRIFRH